MRQGLHRFDTWRRLGCYVVGNADYAGDFRGYPVGYPAERLERQIRRRAGNSVFAVPTTHLNLVAKITFTVAQACNFVLDDRKKGTLFWRICPEKNDREKWHKHTILLNIYLSLSLIVLASY